MTRSPKGSLAHEKMEGEEDHGLLSAAEDIIRAVHSKDASGVAAAIKAAFEICDEAPHEEGPHMSEEG